MERTLDVANKIEVKRMKLKIEDVLDEGDVKDDVKQTICRTKEMQN